MTVALMDGGSANALSVQNRRRTDAQRNQRLRKKPRGEVKHTPTQSEMGDERPAEVPGPMYKKLWMEGHQSARDLVGL